LEARENITHISPAVFNSQKGYANQLIACGILLRLGYEALLAETGNSFYDLIILLNDGHGVVHPIKTGVRTLTGSLSFTVNSGGGLNRPRPIGQGAQIPPLSDVQLWVGVTTDFDLYFLPHSLIVNRTRRRGTVWKPIASLSQTLLAHTQNNADILDNFFNTQWLQQNVLSNIRGSANWR
jgi:hypothetical protein